MIISCSFIIEFFIEAFHCSTQSNSDAFFALGCFPPTVTLIPSSSSISSPLQFYRAHDFTIGSLIQLNCNSSTLITTQWTVKSCNSSCTNRVLLDSTVITTTSELYIPRRTLPCGLYELSFKVTMTHIPNSNITNTVYVQISSSEKKVNLISYGTSMITRGNLQDLQLDPGSYSVDPDEDNFDPSVSYFSSKHC